MRDLLGPPGPLLTTLAMQALTTMAVLTVPVVAPAAALDVGLPATAVGLFIALVYGGSMASSLVCSDLVRRFGAIRVSQVCLLLGAAGLTLAAAGKPWAMGLSALVLGAGYGPITPASSHVLARTTPAKALSLVFSIKQTGVPLGGMLAGAIVPALEWAVGWRAALLGVAVACVGVALIAQSLQRSLDDDREPARPIALGSLARPLRAVLQDAGLRRLAMTSFFFSATQLCLVTYLVTNLTASLGYSLVQAGWMLTVAQAAGVLARIGWGAAADRTRAPLAVLAVVATGMAVGALAMAGFAPGWPVWLIAAVCALFGGTAIGWNGVFLAEVARRAPAGRAAEATGGALVFTYCGVLLAPPLFGLAAAQTGGFAWPYAALAVPAVVCAIGLMRWHRVAHAAR